MAGEAAIQRDHGVVFCDPLEFSTEPVDISDVEARLKRAPHAVTKERDIADRICLDTA